MVELRARESPCHLGSGPLGAHWGLDETHGPLTQSDDEEWLLTGDTVACHYVLSKFCPGTMEVDTEGPLSGSLVPMDVFLGSL